MHGTSEQIHTPRSAQEAAPFDGEQGAYSQRSNHRLSEEAKTTEKGGLHGYDVGKKISGRKRQLLVDTEGLMIGVVVHEANTSPIGMARSFCLGRSAIGWRGCSRFGPTGATRAGRWARG